MALQPNWGLGLFNPLPPSNLLQFLHFNILLVSLSTASNHHPLCLPTGLLSSMYPIMLKVRTHISNRGLASRKVNIYSLIFSCNYLRLHANMAVHKMPLWIMQIHLACHCGFANVTNTVRTYLTAVNTPG